MPNDIPIRQNEDDILKLCRAYHQAYKDSSKLSVFRTVLVIATAVLLPIFGALSPSFRPWAAVVSVFVFAIVLFVLEPQIKRHRTFGAKIQELLDVTLFQFQWPDDIAGDKPLMEDIERLSRRFSTTNSPQRLQNLRDWYPVEIQPLPLPIARLVCQRSNCVWDGSLRSNFAHFLVALLLMLMALGTFFATAMDWTLSEFILSVAIPLLPSIRGVWQESLKQREAAASSTRTRRALESIWHDAMTGKMRDEELAIHTRYIQTELLDRRTSISRIPEWFYKYFRPALEEEMKKAVAAMISTGTDTYENK